MPALSLSFSETLSVAHAHSRSTNACLARLLQHTACYVSTHTLCSTCTMIIIVFLGTMQTSASTVQSPLVNCVFNERRGEHLKHENQTNGVTCFLKGTSLFVEWTKRDLWTKSKVELTGNSKLICCPCVFVETFYSLLHLKLEAKFFFFCFLFVSQECARGIKRTN